MKTISLGNDVLITCSYCPQHCKIIKIIDIWHTYYPQTILCIYNTIGNLHSFVGIWHNSINTENSNSQLT